MGLVLGNDTGTLLVKLALYLSGHGSTLVVKNVAAPIPQRASSVAWWKMQILTPDGRFKCRSRGESKILVKRANPLHPGSWSPAR